MRKTLSVLAVLALPVFGNAQDYGDVFSEVASDYIVYRIDTATSDTASLPQFARQWISGLQGEVLQMGLPKGEETAVLAVLASDEVQDGARSSDKFFAAIKSVWDQLNTGTWSDVGFVNLEDPSPKLRAYLLGALWLYAQGREDEIPEWEQ